MDPRLVNLPGFPLVRREEGVPLNQYIDAQLRKRIRTITLWVGFLLFTLLILWVLLPYKPFVAGIFAGGLVSLHHVIHIAHRLKRAGEMVLAGATPRGTGMVYRILSLMVPLLIALRHPEWIHPWSIFLGLPIGYAVAIAVEIFQLRADRKGGKADWN